jgi:lipopolysaccharide biosynthesis regulator YciM
MKKAIAESYFRLGMLDKGESEYKKLTDENPTWGWGWIGWADEYSIFKENINHDKAIEILTQSLKVGGIDETDEIKLRLRKLYENCGLTDKANALSVGENDKKSMVHSTVIPDGRKVKVGRNEPCPCGSGNKYKRCCGRNN